MKCSDICNLLHCKYITRISDTYFCTLKEVKKDYIDKIKLNVVGVPLFDSISPRNFLEYENRTIDNYSNGFNLHIIRHKVLYRYCLNKEKMLIMEKFNV